MMQSPPNGRIVIDGMPADLYHNIESLSASGAKKLLQSPAHYVFSRDHPAEPSDQMQFGTAVHCGVLEPHAFADRFVALPNIDRRTKEGKATFAEFCQLHPTKTLFDGPTFDRVRSCVDAVNAHPSARMLIDGARTELSLFWTDQQFDVPCKARLDLLNGGIADLKTTRNASKDSFRKDMANLLYHVSAAQYYDACEAVLDRTPDFFVFVCVESEPPHGVACYELQPRDILVGERLMNIARERYRDARKSGRWIGYPETVEAITLPRWAVTFEE